MNLAGPNLYRVHYVIPSNVKDDMPNFQKLVVAGNEELARSLVPGQFKCELVECDISMLIHDACLPGGGAETQLKKAVDALRMLCNCGAFNGRPYKWTDVDAAKAVLQELGG